MSQIVKIMLRDRNLRIGHFGDIEVPLRDALRLAVAVEEMHAARVCKTLPLDDDVWDELLATLATRLCTELRCAVAIFDGPAAA